MTDADEVGPTPAARRRQGTMASLSGGAGLAYMEVDRR